jgi:hypothetical protein
MAMPMHPMKCFSAPIKEVWSNIAKYRLAEIVRMFAYGATFARSE